MLKHIICLFICSFSLKGMELIDLFERYPVNLSLHTDYMYYKLLKEHPISQRVTFVAAPWTHLISKKNLAWIRKNNSEVKFKNIAFTICSHEKFHQMVPFAKALGISIIFSPHVTRNLHFGSVTCVPMPFYPYQGIAPAENKDILASFIGITTSHPIRKTIFQSIKQQPGIYLKQRTSWNYNIQDQGQQERERLEYDEEQKKRNNCIAAYELLCKDDLSKCVRMYFEEL